MDGIPHLEPLRTVNCVTCFVGALVDTETPAAVGEHFRHEGQILQTTVLIKRRQDFRPAAHFDPISDPKVQRSVRD